MGGRKSYLTAEHHNEAAPRFFRLGAEKCCSLDARRKSRFLVLGAEKKKKPPENFLGGGWIIFWGGRKSYLAAEHHYETASKKKKKKSAWAPKNTTLGRLRSKGLATFFRGLREPFRWGPPFFRNCFEPLRIYCTPRGLVLRVNP